MEADAALKHALSVASYPTQFNPRPCGHCFDVPLTDVEVNDEPTSLAYLKHHALILTRTYVLGIPHTFFISEPYTTRNRLWKVAADS